MPISRQAPAGSRTPIGPPESPWHESLPPASKPAQNGRRSAPRTRSCTCRSRRSAPGPPGGRRASRGRPGSLCPSPRRRRGRRRAAAWRDPRARRRARSWAGRGRAGRRRSRLDGVEARMDHFCTTGISLPAVEPAWAPDDGDPRSGRHRPRRAGVVEHAVRGREDDPRADQRAAAAVALADRLAAPIWSVRTSETTNGKASAPAAPPPTMRGSRTSERSSRSTLRPAGRLPVTSSGRVDPLGALARGLGGRRAARPAPSTTATATAAHLRGLALRRPHGIAPRSRNRPSDRRHHGGPAQSTKVETARHPGERGPHPGSVPGGAAPGDALPSPSRRSPGGPHMSASPASPPSPPSSPSPAPAPPSPTPVMARFPPAPRCSARPSCSPSRPRRRPAPGWRPHAALPRAPRGSR